MSPRKPISYVPASDPPGPDPGSFRPDGSWDPRSQERTSCYKFVQRLQEARRMGASPLDVASLVAAGPFPHLLGSSLKLWSSLSSFYDWPLAQPATSACSVIKLTRCSLQPVESDPALQDQHKILDKHGWGPVNYCE